MIKDFRKPRNRSFRSANDDKLLVMRGEEPLEQNVCSTVASDRPICIVRLILETRRLAFDRLRERESVILGKNITKRSRLKVSLSRIYRKSTVVIDFSLL